MSEPEKFDMASALARQVTHAPTHLQDEDFNDGALTRIAARPALPTPAMVALMEMRPRIISNIAWVGCAGMRIQRLEYTKDMGGSLDKAMAIEVYDALPDTTKAWIGGWQELINDGSAWGSAKAIQDRATYLINHGLALCSKQPTTMWWGKPLHTRTNRPSGLPGTVEYVGAWMGPAYVKWLADV